MHRVGIMACMQSCCGWIMHHLMDVPLYPETKARRFRSSWIHDTKITWIISWRSLVHGSVEQQNVLTALDCSFLSSCAVAMVSCGWSLDAGELVAIDHELSQVMPVRKKGLSANAFEFARRRHGKEANEVQPSHHLRLCRTRAVAAAVST